MRPLFLAVTLVSLIVAAFGATAALQDAEPIDTLPGTEDHAASTAMAPSNIEDATGIEYQDDANVHGDAPGTCQTVDPRRILATDDGPIPAMLVENDDEADAFHIPIGSSYVGARLRLDLTASVGAELMDVAFDIVDAACGFSVFDPDADIYHPQRGVPSEPFSAKAGYQTYDYAPDAEYICDDTAWKFLIKHKRGINPSSLYVEWSNGDHTYIANDDLDPSQVGKYLTTHNLQHTITRLAVQMPAAFDGELTIAHGPCDLTQAVAPNPPATNATSGEFTVVQAGNYVLIITLERGIMEKATGLDPLLRCDPGCAFMQGIIGLDIDLHALRAAT